MKYVINDRQFDGGRLFADGAVFDSVEDCIDQLIDYHSIDCDMSGIQRLLDAGRIEDARREIEDFEWEIIPAEDYA